MSTVGSLRHRVGEAIAHHGLWRAGDRVAVAVSGGVDSVCLLDLLVATAGWHGGVLSVVTVDHGTRAESAGDARFVEALAAGHGLACVRIELHAGDASEARLRELRYAAFAGLDVDRIALGHHRDDLAETVLIHLLRGTGTTGLGGMRRRRDRYVRPLLDVPRAELLDYAAARGLHWREDPTNADPGRLRNRVRGEVLPLLEAIRPGGVGAVARGAQLAAQDAAFIDAIVDATPEARPGPDGLSCRWLVEAAEPLARRALLRMLPSAAAVHVDALLRAARAGRGAVTLPDGRVVAVRDGFVRIPESGAADGSPGAAGG